MARKKKKSDPSKAVEGGAEMDMTPMIDITFQLIIFFLVANDLSKKEIETVALPQALAGVEDKGDEKEERIIINVLPPDDIANPALMPKVRVRGVDHTIESLTSFLKAKANQRSKGEDGTSNLYALVRADNRAPWQHVQFVMQACADPSVKIWKLQFATTKRDDGKATAASDADE